MAVIDLYSKRQKKLEGEQSDMYIYDEIPKKFRIQVKFIIEDLIDEYEQFVKPLREEYGVEKLANVLYVPPCLYSYREELFKFFLETADHKKCLDVIELIFKYVFDFYKSYAVEHINTLNTRFKENNLGYSFENNQIIRIDSELLHSEAIKPALQFLSHPGYENANEEFLDAFEDYKKGKYGDANHKCRHAFESTMKIICNKRGYEFDNDKDTVSSLLTILKNNKFFPIFAEDHLNHLVGLLQGVGTISNKKGLHGKGINNEPIPPYLTGYLLHATASAILFFSEIEKNRGNQ